MSTYKFSYISLKNELREFDKRSKHSSFLDHFNNSRNLFSWWCNDNVTRKLMLITLGSVSIIAMSVEVVNNTKIGNCAIFVWPWNENARKKQKQQTNGNIAIWLVYRTETNSRGFWLVKRTPGWKNGMPENFLQINRYFDLTSYCNTIVLIFLSIGW